MREPSFCIWEKRRRSAAGGNHKAVQHFCFRCIRIVKFLCFLNLKCQASSHPVCVGLGRKPPKIDYLVTWLNFRFHGGMFVSFYSDNKSPQNVTNKYKTLYRLPMKKQLPFQTCLKFQYSLTLSALWINFNTILL